MCALDYRQRTGKGQYINLSQFEATGGGDRRRHDGVPGQWQGAAAARATRRPSPRHMAVTGAGEDRWCVIAVAGEAEWERFCGAVGRPDWTRDPRFATLSARLQNVAELDRLVEEWTASRADDEVMNALQEVGIAAGVVQNVETCCTATRSWRRGLLRAGRTREEGARVTTGIPLGLTGNAGPDRPRGRGRRRRQRLRVPRSARSDAGRDTSLHRDRGDRGRTAFFTVPRERDGLRAMHAKGS